MDIIFIQNNLKYVRLSIMREGCRTLSDVNSRPRTKKMRKTFKWALIDKIVIYPLQRWYRL